MIRQQAAGGLGRQVAARTLVQYGVDFILFTCINHCTNTGGVSRPENIEGVAIGSGFGHDRLETP